MDTNRVIFAVRHRVEGCAPKRMSFECQELYISYYII